MDFERLLVDNLPLIDRIVGLTCRRHRMTKEEAEDFASAVNVKLIDNDYRVLRDFTHRCSLPGYLNTVIQHALQDHRNHLLGKWRPSAEARRLGPLAVRLDTLLHRDLLTLDEACATVPEADRQEMRRLAGLLPGRIRRRLEGAQGLEQVSAPGPSPEERLIAAERELAAEGLGRVLAELVQGLPAEDQLLIRLRLQDGLKLASVARSFGCDPRQLYRRWELLLRQLRTTLERRGYDAKQVAWVLDLETDE
jgi:RNA polymerase sigma factor (sigma-70 family)